MTTRSFPEQLSDMWRTRPVRLPEQGHVAGVCTGIGMRYGVDPVLIRVAFTVSAIFGGAGIVLYLAAWVLFTRRGDQVSPLESLMGRGNSSDSSTKVIVILVALAIAASAVGPVGAGFGGSGFIGAFLMLGGWWLLYQRQPEPPVGFLPPEGGFTADPSVSPEQPFQQGIFSHGMFMHQMFTRNAFGQTTTSTPPPTGLAPGDPGYLTGTPEATAGTTQEGTTPMSTPSGTPNLRKEPDPGAPTKDSSPAAPGPPAWDPLGVAPFAWDLPAPAPARDLVPTGKRRSRLTTTVLGLAVLAAAAAGAVAVAGDVAWMTPARVGAIALAVIGAGMIVGAFLHRGHGLLVVTGPLLGFVVLASIIGPMDHSNWGNRHWAPTSAAELQPAYASHFGEMTLDLRNLQLTEDYTVDVDGSFGNVEVLLPENLDVRTTCSVDAGEITQCPEPGLDGGRDGEKGPVLTLDAAVDFGNLEVHRG